MSLGRRKIGIEESDRWVFNRMAHVYGARPPYPVELIDALAALVRQEREQALPQGRRRSEGAGRSGPGRVADLGAGIGHVALPLAARGLEVAAIEPAGLMLRQLEAAARDASLPVRAFHASAEKLPLDDASIDLVIVADALHFLDAELTAEEIRRVMVPGAALAIVTCEFSDTPFMRDLTKVIQAAVPRRPRDLTKQLVQLSSITQIPFGDECRFHDETPVDHATLDQILRSISFIGPAMNPERFATFRGRVHALGATPAWARTFVLRSGRRPRRRVSTQRRAPRATPE